MSLETTAIERLPLVRAGLNFILPSTQKPRSFEYDPPAGMPRTTAFYEERAVAIRNMRSVASGFSLEREGVRLVTAPSDVADFYDESQIRNVYYPEAEKLVTELTGASRAVIFDHTIRRRIDGAADRTTGVPRQPVPRVHVDYTVKSGPQRVRDLLADEADELLRRRFSVINVWRPIRGPLQDSPLAVSDASSVQFDDLVPVDLVYQDRIGEIYMVKFNPSQRWFYAPRMSSDEVLAFKCYDSAEDGRARFAPHAAFEDPTAPLDAWPRESIELRVLAFHGA
ncbi:MAG TPA: CmcJ/NvfI family oxidoreductase [Steroidobacteraceae bacterium]|nr:CmcJ/NvfI family oxidoreductase [Steroidobacteraceae bacterium]